MRTIRFRGKRMSDGEWLYGFLNEALSPIKVNNDVSNLRIGRSFVRTSTIGQFTGLHDKNGKEIYEGDIVKWEYPYYDSCTGWRGTVKNVCKVTFEYGSFRINAYPYNLGSCEDFFEDKETYGLKVIGNIHDNPELQKGGEQ